MKKFNSFFFLFLLSLLLLFTSFIFVGQNLLHKNNVDNIISTFDTIKFLKENKANIYARSMSAPEILEAIHYMVAKDTVTKYLRLLKCKGLVDEGAKVVRAKGYIITSKGEKVIPPLISNKEEQKND